MVTPQLLDLFTTAAKQHEAMFAKRVREPPARDHENAVSGRGRDNPALTLPSVPL